MGTISLAMNLGNKAIAQYHSFSYDSFCPFKGRYFLFYSAGIAEIAENLDDDQGVDIEAFATFVSTDFGEMSRKRVMNGSLNFRCTGQMKITWQGDEDRSAEVIIGPENTEPYWQTIKFPGHRRVEGTELEFTIANMSGSDFNLATMDVDLVTMSRGKSRK